MIKQWQPFRPPVEPVAEEKLFDIEMLEEELEDMDVFLASRFPAESRPKYVEPP
jgi:hypothetical protein